MIIANLPDNEEERLHKLYETGILDTFEEQAYDDITKLAAEICGTPIALVSLIDQHRQWFKSHHGLAARETPRDHAFCAHAILDDEVFIVEDSSKDERFHDNPLYTGEPHVRFYAGAPLIMSDNIKLGTLCVIGNQAQTITPGQKESLQALARQVVSQLELRLRLKELEALDHLKNEFTGMVSHELRTPLTAIFGSLSLLLNGKAGALEGDTLKLVKMSFRNTERLLNIVNDILDVSKLESGTFVLEKTNINIVSLLNIAVELNEQYCKDCRTYIKFVNSDSAAVLIHCDEHRLLQVMSNFISNAAKFTHREDTIEISIETSNNSVTVAVSDHGPGIPADKRELLFKKFSQINASINHKQPGTGLGLNICKKIIELHDGTIGVDSRPNIKTSFYFTLPLADT